jgi:hypothetical protein
VWRRGNLSDVSAREIVCCDRESFVSFKQRLEILILNCVRNKLKRLGVDERIILKWMLKKINIWENVVWDHLAQGRANRRAV